jgi:prevent-host-death family protein
VVVEAGVRELRDNLKSFLDRVREGDEIVVTDRGKRIARITPYAREAKRQELIARGILTPAKAPKQSYDVESLVQLEDGGSLSDLVIEERRSARY